MILIEIPESITYDQMLDYIINKYKEKNIKISKNIMEIDLKEIINKSYMEGENQNGLDAQKRIEEYLLDDDEEHNDKK